MRVWSFVLATVGLGALAVQAQAGTGEVGATALSPLAPVQVTSWGVDEDGNGRFQSAGTNPEDGSGLIVSYTSDMGSYSWVAIPIDDAGAASGPEVTLIATGAYEETFQLQNPAVEYDPVSGGWVVCLGNEVASTVDCWFLNPDGTVKAGSPFVISTGADGGPGGWRGYYSVGIEYSPTEGKWFAAFSDYDYMATNWFDASGTVTRGVDIEDEGDGTGGIDLAYSSASDRFMAVGRLRPIGADTEDGAYVWYFDGDGSVLDGPDRVGAGDIEYKNPVIAYNAVRDEFMIANFVRNETEDLSTQRYSAATGQPVADEALSEIDGATFRDGRNRIAIAASPYGDDYMGTTRLAIVDPVEDDEVGNYVLSIDGEGMLGEIASLIGPNTVLGYNQRPRIAFNQVTCEYLATYNSPIDGPSWELFSSRVPSETPCETPATDPDLRVSIGGAKKARAGKAFKVGIRVTNRQLLTRSAEGRSGPAESVRTCLTLPRTLFVARASGASTKAHRACWTRSELAVGSSVTYLARIRVAKSAASTRAVASLRASVTASGEGGDQVSVSGSRKVRILPARVPRPQPPTG
jgi:hypothetical protein